MNEHVTSEDRLRYIEDFAANSRQFGLGGVAGKVLGALLVWDPPELSAEELAGLLSVDEEAVVRELNAFVRAGVVVSGGDPETTRDRFCFNPEAWEVLISRQLVSLMTFRRLAERGLDLLGADEHRPRRNLKEMRDRYAYAERELPELFERFEQERVAASAVTHDERQETLQEDVSYVHKDSVSRRKEGNGPKEPARRAVS